MTFRGTIKNLGLGGVLLESSAPLTKLERITMTLPAAASGTITIGAVVVRYQREDVLGVAFVTMSADDQQQIRDAIRAAL